MSEKVLTSIYYNTSNPGSYGGVDKLYREARKKLPGLKKSFVQSWLSGELVYTLHKPARRKFKRNPVIAEHVSENFQADLVDMQEFFGQNDGYRYILTVIDVFSKYAWAIPIKSKTASSVAKAMEQILNQRVPIKLQTDRGKEFDNNVFRKLMKKYDVNFFMTNNKDIKCSVVERFNRTFKTNMNRFFTKDGSRRYIDELDNLLNSYNKSYHKSIKMAPEKVNEYNEKEVFLNIYKHHSKRELLRKLKKPKLKPGDKVRKKYILGPLDRGYYPNWSDNVYTIYKSSKNLVKPLYHIKEANGQVVKQRHYPEELQKIKDNNIYRVEKIISEKITKGVKYFKVKWLNHPSSENSWIKSDDLFNINGER
jgi:hypothetical protein